MFMTSATSVNVIKRAFMASMLAVGTVLMGGSSTAAMTQRSPLARLVPVRAEPPDSSLPPRPVRRSAPRRPDARLVIGVVLIVLSAGLGVVILGKPQTTAALWSASRDLPAGTVLEQGDLTSTLVASPIASYLASTDSVIGQRLAKPLAAGELIHASDIAQQRIAPATRLVTIPVDALHAPSDLERGHRVDLWSTPVIESVISTPQLVLSNLFVAQVPSLDERGISSNLGITLEVPIEAVGAVIAALRAGDVDVVRVPAVAP